MRTLHFEAADTYSVHREELWPLVSDTARLNRAIGLRAVKFTHQPRSDGGSVVTGEFTSFGMTVARWTEHAFDFVRPHRYSVLREYSKGPLVRLDGGVELTVASEGTRVRVFADVTTRNMLGDVLATRIVRDHSTTSVLKQCRIFEEYLRGRRKEAFPQLAPGGGVNTERLNHLATRLLGQGADPAGLEQLRGHLRSASDDQVVAMRPFELADGWGVDRSAMLEICLRATTVGLLDLRWDVLCPNCRISKAEYRSLAELGPQAHCETCNVTFDANFDRLVEVRFNVSRAIRDAEIDGAFCIGGPQVTPHVLAQAELDRRGRLEWNTPLDSGLYRLRSPQAAGAALIDVDSEAPNLGEASPGFTVSPEGITPSTVRTTPGELAIAVQSQVDAPVVVALEQAFWPDTAATAALVSTFQEFRDLFSSELLAPGLQIGIERLTLLFTDLAGSTALYEGAGQARAFRLVQDHFRLIEDAARSNHGAIVKSIGDALMCVFPTPADALDAALAMQRAMPILDTPEGVDTTRLLKVGIHVGPCVAVTLNDRLDYFGTTVNIAARVEHEARGGETVITEAAQADLGVAGTLNALGLPLETSQVNLKGIRDPVGLIRIPFPTVR